MVEQAAGHARIVNHPDLTLYDFGPQHPLRPERITAGLGLLEAAELWVPGEETLVPVVAEAAELELVHSAAYVRAVDEIGSGHLPRSEQARHGFASTDNPAFPDMHYAAALVAGAAVTATRAIMDDRLDHVFSPAGGLHHALRARASGFCVYNDPAVAAAVAVEEYGARVLYIDLDCHHGDGVQWLFYDRADLFTVSFHESGRFLFPGTGDVAEIGEGTGWGYCLNVPFSPFTRDDSWGEALDELIEAIAEQYRPDLLISNHGCDTHVWDPLTHLSLSTASFVRQAALMHRVAHRFAGGRWLAVGSGGYEWRRVVPRSWSILWAEMAGREVPVELPARWREEWLGAGEWPRPYTFMDGDEVAPGGPREEEIRRWNRETIEAATRVVRDAVAGG
jgi:acetoin utilization protein AcuC